MNFDRYKPMPKSLQKYLFGKLLEKNGIEQDLVDLEALIDSKLSYNENLRCLEQYLKTKLKESEDIEEQEDELQDFNHSNLLDSDSKEISKEILRLMRDLSLKVNGLEQNQEELNRGIKKISRKAQKSLSGAVTKPDRGFDTQSKKEPQNGVKNGVITYNEKPIGFLKDPLRDLNQREPEEPKAKNYLHKPSKVNHTTLEKPLTYNFIVNVDPFILKKEIERIGKEAKQKCTLCGRNLRELDNFFMCIDCKHIYAYDQSSIFHCIFKYFWYKILKRYSYHIKDDWVIKHYRDRGLDAEMA